jgi:hypothetical protein
MDEMINARIEEVAAPGNEAGGGDLLSNLVIARSREKSADVKQSASSYLSHSELRG